VEREKLVDILFVWNLGIEVNIGDFTCVTCFCMLAWWKILHL